MAKRIYERYLVKKDIVIPKGTVLESINDGNTDPIECIVGLSRDTSGVFRYWTDNDMDNLKEYLEKIEPKILLK
jgi:hypothetical protein